VLSNEIQLLTKCYLILPMTTQRRTQHLAQLFDNCYGRLPLVVPYENGDRVERVKKKVRITLRLQCCEACARQLFGQASYLKFAFPCLNEIATGVLDTDNTQINRNPKRQRNENPT